MASFKNRNVMQIVISQLFSGVATWCVTLGIQMIIIFRYNATITGVSALYCAALLPRIILPSFLGTYLDRVKSRVLVVKIGRLFAALVAVICYFSQGTIQMIILAFVLNAVLSAEEPGMIGVIRNLSDNDDGFDILGIYYMLADIIKIIGPSIAAGISFFTTNKNLFLVATVLFVGSAVLLRVKEATTRRQAKVENKKTLNRFEVVKLIFSQGELLYIFIIVFTFLFSLNAIDTSSGILIRTFTNKSYIQAVFVALMGIGGTIGSLIVLRLINKVNLLTLNLISMFIFGLLLCMVVFITTIAELLIIVTLAGLLAPGIIMSAEIRRQKLVTKSQSSRLSGLTLMVNSIAQLAGIVVSPVIANGLSPAEVFVVCGLLIITIALFGLIFGNRFVKAN